MSEQLHKVLYRNKDIDVYVRDSSGPMTTFRFVYNKTNLENQIYLPDDLSEQDYNILLSENVKRAVAKYNKSRRLRNAK